MLMTSRMAYGPNLVARLLNACSLDQIDAYAKAAWVLNGEGLISNENMEYLEPVIEHRRQMFRPDSCSAGRCGRVPFSPSRFPCHRRAGIPPEKRAASWLRRRGLAKDCPIPTCLARMFTVSKLAVLAVVAGAVMERGQSDMSLPEIAAKAGVGCTIARYALRQATELGLIVTTENRQRGRRNLPNTIRIVAASWLKWLQTAKRIRASGSARRANSRHVPPDPLKNVRPTNEIIIIGKAKAAVSSHQKAVNDAPP
ncbi:hypothetical protein RMS29_026630 (plasmid) [Agrobacterium rosae]|uniref:HTH iclR-type domain-containing protein n=1 Tax=Agrobacterium rosae TaxID=1972867 RepID=A0ABU4W262_9HYPH|nr:hypothetical protein [Agrobacterium rosae]MDX8331870.1 hypothetical protein [Agrobacterium rosae]